MSVKETEYEYNREIVVRPVGRGLRQPRTA